MSINNKIEQSNSEVSIGLVGFGTVGESLYHVLQQTPTLNSAITRVCIKHADKKRNALAALFTTDANVLLNDDSITVIVELIDDADAAYAIVKAALQKGKAVVSANKKMIASHLAELLELQHTYNVPFLYEAAACASIPVIRNLEEYYDNDLLQGIQGIVNGSTNYILTKIATEGLSFDEALYEAQVAGFAESDPSLDVNGTDAVNKLSILLAHAYGIQTSPESIVHSGIQHLHEADATFAKEKDYSIKLIAQARKLANGKIAAFVLPQLLKEDNLLYNVRNEYNGVIIESGFADQQFFYGKGAGGIATASAVLSDISALRYNYRYEYKKLYQQRPAQLTDDFYLRVYVSFEGLFQVPHELFEKIESWTSTDQRCAVTGIIHCSRLRNVAWWKRPGASLILLPNPIIELSQLEERTAKQNEAVLEFA